MKIAHITDIHYKDSMSAEININSMNNLNRILDDAAGLGIGLVVLTGDYGEPEGFDDIAEAIRIRGLQYYYILGNHDEFSYFSSRTDAGGLCRPDGLYFAVSAGGSRMIFLDTSSAVISGAQLDFLNTELKAAEGSPVMLFSHHPILYCGNMFMDRNYPLKNRGSIVRLLREFAGNVTVFSGHYHAEHAVMSGNINQYVTLSVLRQLNSDSDVLELGSSDFGYRIADTDCPSDTRTVRFSL